MTSLYNIGDIVALKSHPYSYNALNIIISGDHRMVPPLMVVTEIMRTKQRILGSTETSEIVKYRCLWFAEKDNKFKEGLILECDLKEINKAKACLLPCGLKRGDKVVLKTCSYELAKRKSSLTYNDNVSNSQDLTITALLTYVSPVLQVLDIKQFVSKSPLKEKSSGEVIRIVSSFEIKCLLYDTTSNKLSEVALPLEVLELVPRINESLFSIIEDAINNSYYLKVAYPNKKVNIVQPKSISHRAGNYYLRAFDFIINKVIEIDLSNNLNIELTDTPFLETFPQFNIEDNPIAATHEYITKELAGAINKARERKSFIRIRYKNKNDIISRRTIQDYKVIEVKESNKDVIYLSGYCLLRNAERHFRIDRIQDLQELKLSFK